MDSIISQPTASYFLQDRSNSEICRWHNSDKMKLHKRTTQTETTVPDNGTRWDSNSTMTWDGDSTMTWDGDSTMTWDEDSATTWGSHDMG